MHACNVVLSTVSCQSRAHGPTKLLLYVGRRRTSFGIWEQPSIRANMSNQNQSAIYGLKYQVTIMPPIL